MRINRRSFVIIELILLALVVMITIGIILGRINKEPERVFVIINNSEESNRTALRYGLRMAAQDTEADLVIVSTGELSSNEEEIDIIKNEIENGADAFIVEPVSSTEDMDAFYEISRQVPLIFINNSDNLDGEKIPSIAPDNYRIGQELAQKIKSDYNNKINGKTFGILLSAEDTSLGDDRESGFSETIESNGGKIQWVSKETTGDDGQMRNLKSLAKVDFVVALDDYSLVEAGEYSLENKIKGAVVYGIGNSTEAVYHMEKKNVESLIIPDDFEVGYKSFTEAAKKLGKSTYKIQSQKATHTVLNRNELFDDKNQRLLFTMSQ